MSITDELREAAHYMADPTHDFLPLVVSGDLLAIADRIDAEHKHAIAYVDDRDPETMAEHGWIRMPFDANGVLILDRDKMAAPNGNVFVVTHMLLQDGEWVIQSWPASCLIHYKTTVENILADMLDEWGELPSDEPAGEIIAKYAAKLQLKEDE